MEGSSQLKWLMDYTLFHIGTYITLSTLLLGILGLEGFKERNAFLKPFLLATLVCFMIAGACGGVVASNIPYFAKFEKLQETPIGPHFGWVTGQLATWTFVEHAAFWSGIFIALLGVSIATFRRQKAPTMAEAEKVARRLSKECLDSSIVFRELKEEFVVAQNSLADAARKAASTAELVRLADSQPRKM